MSDLLLKLKDGKLLLVKYPTLDISPIFADTLGGGKAKGELLKRLEKQGGKNGKVRKGK